MTRFRKKAAFKDFISASEWNQLTEIVASILQASGINAIVDSTGIHFRKGLSKEGVRIAAVVSNATGGGYYNCTIQKLDSTKWNTNSEDHLSDDGRFDSIVVLNLAESPITGDTTSHLLNADTLMEIWPITDDAGNVRWVGHEIARYFDCT